MAVSVLHKRAQSRVRSLSLPSLLGDGMPERLRSTSIALVGIVAAAGLGTVALALQLGLPSVVGGPLPEPPAVAKGEGFERKAATEATAEAAAAPAAPEADADGRSPAPDPGPSEPVAREPSGGAVVVTRPPPVRSRPERSSSPRRTPAHNPSAEAPPPEAPPFEPSAAASEVPPPAAAPEAPVPAHPGNGNAYGKGNGKSIGNGAEPPGQVAKAAGQAEAGE